MGNSISNSSPLNNGKTNKSTFDGGATDGQLKSRRKCVTGFLDTIDQTIIDSGHASLLATSHRAFTWKDPNSEYFLLEQAMDYLKVDASNPKVKKVLDRFFTSLHMINLPAGFVVYSQGDKGTNMYLVESGKLQVTIGINDVSTLECGDIFGDKSLIFGYVRTATITCMEKCILWSINRVTYASLRKELSSTSHLKGSKRFLEIPAIASLSNHQLEKLLIHSKKYIYTNEQKLCTIDRGLSKIILIENGFVDCAIPTYLLDMKLPKEEMLKHLGISIDLTPSLDVDKDQSTMVYDEDQINPDDNASVIDDVSSVASMVSHKVILRNTRKKSRILKKMVKVLQRKNSVSTLSRVIHDTNIHDTNKRNSNPTHAKDYGHSAREERGKNGGNNSDEEGMVASFTKELVGDNSLVNAAGDHHIGEIYHQILPPTSPERSGDDNSTSSSPKNTILPPLSSPLSSPLSISNNVSSPLSPTFGRTSPATIISATLNNALSLETESLLSTTTGSKRNPGILPVVSRTALTRTSICISQLPEMHQGLQGIEKLIDKQSGGGLSRRSNSTPLLTDALSASCHGGLESLPEKPARGGFTRKSSMSQLLPDALSASCHGALETLVEKPLKEGVKKRSNSNPLLFDALSASCHGALETLVEKPTRGGLTRKPSISQLSSEVHNGLNGIEKLIEKQSKGGIKKNSSISPLTPDLMSKSMHGLGTPVEKPSRDGLTRKSSLQLPDLMSKSMHGLSTLVEKPSRDGLTRKSSLQIPDMLSSSMHGLGTLVEKPSRGGITRKSSLQLTDVLSSSYHGLGKPLVDGLEKSEKPPPFRAGGGLKKPAVDRFSLLVAERNSSRDLKSSNLSRSPVNVPDPLLSSSLHGVNDSGNTSDTNDVSDLPTTADSTNPSVVTSNSRSISTTNTRSNSSTNTRSNSSTNTRSNSIIITKAAVDALKRRPSTPKVVLPAEPPSQVDTPQIDNDMITNENGELFLRLGKGALIGLGVLPSLLKEPGASQWVDYVEEGVPNVGSLSTFTATAVGRVHTTFFSTFDFEKLFGSSRYLFASKEIADFYTEAVQEAETLKENALIKGEMETLLMRRLLHGIPKVVTVKTFVDVKPLVWTSTGLVCTGSLPDEKIKSDRSSSNSFASLVQAATPTKGLGKTLKNIKNAIVGGKNTNTTLSRIAPASNSSPSRPLNEMRDKKDDDDNDDDEMDHVDGVKQYALKIVYKDLAVNKSAVAKVLNEAKILGEMPLSQHPCIPRLVTKFQTNDALVMVMEKINTNPCDLWSLIYELGFKGFKGNQEDKEEQPIIKSTVRSSQKSEKTELIRENSFVSVESTASTASLIPDTEMDGFVLTVDMARFYVGSVVMVLHDLHTAGIAYRNLKAENILIDHKGYVKMTGFGWSKRFPYIDDDSYVKMRSHTLCGTPEYMAPEIILQTGHNTSVDSWALGCLMYELLIGKTPFAHEAEIIHTRQGRRFVKRYEDGDCRIMEAIAETHRKGLKFHPKALSELRSIPGALPLIEGLLVPLRTHRTLITLKPNSEIMKSAFFQDFDWNALRNMTMIPPYIPPIPSEITEQENEVIRPSTTARLAKPSYMDNTAASGSKINKEITHKEYKIAEDVDVKRTSYFVSSTPYTGDQEMFLNF